MSITGDMFEPRNQEFAECFGDLSIPLSSPTCPFVTYDDFSCEPNHFTTTKDTVPSATAQVGEQQNNDLGLSLQCTTTTEPATATAAAGTDRTPSWTIPNEALVLETMGLDWPDFGDHSFPLSSPTCPFVTYEDFSCEPNHFTTTKDTVPSATAQVGEQQNNDLGLSLQCTTTTEPATATAAAGTDRTPSWTNPNEALVLEMVGPDWPEQQPGLLMERDAALTLNNGGGGGDTNSLCVPVSVASANADKPNKTKKGGPVTGDTGGISISLEQLQQLFGKPREEAADILEVSVSKLKRISREHGIKRWPFKKKNNRVVKKVSSSRRNCTCSSGPDPKKLVAAAATNVIQTSPQPAAELAMQDARPIIFKAYCENFIIRFELPSTLKMVDVEQEVAKRLGLKTESFNIHYLDEYNDWVLINCDDDLRRLQSWTTIQILVTQSSKLITLISEFNLISTSFGLFN